jgi:phosphoribosylglycinamide formyltransferase-1
MKKVRIAVFASGNGSNAINLFNFFKNNDTIEIGLLYSNNPLAKVIDLAIPYGIKTIVANNEKSNDSTFLTRTMEENEIDYIVLAGYLRLIPSAFISTYSNRIFNIHPSLLPKYGGKGMYGDHVHHAVLANKETISGISIHFVNEAFDEGRMLAQFSFDLKPADTLFEIKTKIAYLEQKYYPIVIENSINYDRVF